MKVIVIRDSFKCKLQSCAQDRNKNFNPDAGQPTCPQVGNGNDLPRFQDYGSRVVDEIPRHHQAIIPSYKLVCNQMCGNITEWGVDVQPGGRNDEMGAYTLDLQVWRPSPTPLALAATVWWETTGSPLFL